MQLLLLRKHFQEVAPVLENVLLKPRANVKSQLYFWSEHFQQTTSVASGENPKSKIKLDIMILKFAVEKAMKLKSKSFYYYDNKIFAE